MKKNKNEIQTKQNTTTQINKHNNITSVIMGCRSGQGSYSWKIVHITVSKHHTMEWWIRVIITSNDCCCLWGTKCFFYGNDWEIPSQRVQSVYVWVCFRCLFPLLTIKSCRQHTKQWSIASDPMLDRMLCVLWVFLCFMLLCLISSTYGIYTFVVCVFCARSRQNSFRWHIYIFFEGTPRNDCKSLRILCLSHSSDALAIFIKTESSESAATINFI